MFPFRPGSHAWRTRSSTVARQIFCHPLWLPLSTPLSPSSPLFRQVHGGRTSPASASHPAPAAAPGALPLEKLIDEEQLPSYDARKYYPANPGDVLDDRYKLVAKLCFGSNSTVWLAEVTCRDTSSEKGHYVAIKMCNCNIPEPERWSEAEMNIHLATTSPDHQGYDALGVAFEAFEVLSPRGDTHIALVFLPLREPLWLFKRRLDNERSGSQIDRLPLFKTYIQILLEGLSYMHSHCRIVHTDLKLDNIMLTFENQGTIKAYVDKQIAHPMARKVLDDHVVYRCHNDLGPVLSDLGKMIPNITDFGLAHRCEVPVLFHPMQPDAYRAPEVLLGYRWSFSAGIWNFGLVVWELLIGRPLFSSAPYSGAQHLADMIALLGDVPLDILRREKDMRYHRWHFKATNSAGRLCDNATDFYGGPFFNDEGSLLHGHVVPSSRKLESEIPKFLRSEVELFLPFMRRMLCWTPEDRASADELINDPWLGPCRWR